MRYFYHTLKLTFIIAFFVACGRTNSNPKVNSTNDTMLTSNNSIDTIFIYGGDLLMQIKSHDTILETKIFKQSSDTIYYPNGTPRSIIVGRSEDFDSKHYEYYSNSRLKTVWEQSTQFGCGNKIGEQLNYDSTGYLFSKTTFKHNLPKNATGCHETHTVETTREYYDNGRVRLKKQQEHFYESETCDCGTWEYFDEQGKLIKKEKHESCDDDSLSCSR